MCRDLLDDVVLVTEEEIYRAMQTLYYEERMVAEGACVVGIAALEGGKLDLTGPTGTIITGRNLDMRVLAQVIVTGRTCSSATRISRDALWRMTSAS